MEMWIWGDLFTKYRPHSLTEDTAVVMYYSSMNEHVSCAGKNAVLFCRLRVAKLLR